MVHCLTSQSVFFSQLSDVCSFVEQSVYNCYKVFLQDMAEACPVDIFNFDEKFLYSYLDTQGNIHLKLVSGEKSCISQTTTSTLVRVTGALGGSQKFGNCYRCKTKTTASIAVVIFE